MFLDVPLNKIVFFSRNVSVGSVWFQSLKFVFILIIRFHGDACSLEGPDRPEPDLPIDINAVQSEQGEYVYYNHFNQACRGQHGF